MNKKNGCKMRECVVNHRREIVGGIFLILATFLTFTTLSSLGIFGMFLTGVFMCCHRHMCCCKNKPSECCDSKEHCESHEEVKGTTKKTVKAAK